MSWAAVWHSCVVRVSCFVVTNAARADVIDVDLNNILSFGFGANAGLTPSCLNPVSNTTEKPVLRAKTDPTSSPFINSVKYIGWLVLFADTVLCCSILLLIKLSEGAGADKKASKIFMISVSVSILLSFIYSILYISSFISIGGTFPIFEFVFTFVDLFLWIYSVIVIKSYRHQST